MRNRIVSLVFVVSLVGCGGGEGVTPTAEDSGQPTIIINNNFSIPDGGVGTTVVNTTNTTIINNYYGGGLDGGAAPAIDTGSAVEAASSDAGTAAEANPVSTSCSVGDQIFIGHGFGQVMSGSAKGFGIAWDSNYRTLSETDVMFQAVDRHGAELSAGEMLNVTEGPMGPVLDIAAMSGSYVIGATWLNSVSGFWSRGFSGSVIFSTHNQPQGYLPIVGSDDEYFAFMNNGSPSSVLNKLQLGVGFFTVENTYGWGPGSKNTPYPTKGVKFDSSSWAFALTVGTVTEVAAVIADGVNPTVIIDTASIGGTAGVSDIIAIDDGYAVRWGWFPENLSSRRSFISFVPAKGSPDGKVHETIEISSLASGIQMVEAIAWNGKNIGYLTMNANPNPFDASQSIGKFFLLDRKGTVLKTATVASPFLPQTTGQTVSFASSGSSFGIASSYAPERTVRFQSVDCD